MSIQILVATHKSAPVPTYAPYLPIHVGAEGSSVTLPYQRDNEGENISGKNSSYCELTGVYWAWKNLDASVVGLNHYRRVFVSNKLPFGSARLLTSAEIDALLRGADILLPKKRHYWIESNESHYLNAHEHEPLGVMKAVIGEQFPEFAASLDRVLARRSAHMFNMLIAPRKTYDSYCDFMFSVLAEVEGRIDISNYSKVEQRVFGFLSELLLDVYVDAKQLRVREVNYRFTEKQNWPKKIWEFARRKLQGNGLGDSRSGEFQE